MTPDQAREVLISAIDYAADSSLHDADKNRLFGSDHYGSGRPIVQPSPWSDGDFEENIVQVLARANILNRNAAHFVEAKQLLEAEDSVLGRIILRAKHIVDGAGGRSFSSDITTRIFTALSP